MLTILKKCPLFEGTQESFQERLLNECETRCIKADEFLFHRGDNGKGMYIILDGKLAVVLEKINAGEDKLVAELGPSAFFGELLVLTQGKRTASIKALTDAKLLHVKFSHYQQKITERDFDMLMMSHNIANILAQRLTQTINLVEELSLQQPDKMGKSEIAQYRDKLLSELL